MARKTSKHKAEADRQMFEVDCRRLKELGEEMRRMKILKTELDKNLVRVWEYIKRHPEEMMMDNRTPMPDTDGAVLGREKCRAKVIITKPRASLRYLIEHHLEKFLRINREAMLQYPQAAGKVPGITLGHNTQTVLRFPDAKIRLVLSTAPANDED